MSTKMLFKLWNVERTKKIFVPIDAGAGNIYDNLILTGSEKMNINGSKLVLEADGTTIDDDEILKLLCSEIIIMLQPGETWQPVLALHKLEDDLASLSDTITLNSSDLSASSSGLDLIQKSLSVSSAQETSQKTLNPIDESLGASAVAYENSWLSFAIPWAKINDSALQDCEMGRRNHRSISNVIQTVADSMRVKSRNISNKAIRTVAHKIVARYPRMFQDVDDDGVVMGDDGAIVVFSQLKERLKYLNRPYKRNSDDSPNTVPLKEKKKMLSAKAGCSNWQPPVTMSSSTVIDQLKTVNFDVFDEATQQLLENTYANQREFLNKPEPPSIEDISSEWPILLSEKGIYWHFKKLMGVDVNDLGANMLKKSQKIVNFGLKKNFVRVFPENETDKITATIETITSFFAEPINDIIYVQSCEESDITSISSPRVICPKEGSTKKYTVVMEGKKLNSSESLISSLQQMFALYYMFNLEYPKSVSNTLEVFQRYFLKIYPEQGTKNKKAAKCKLKILSFINKLRDFE